MKCQRWHCRHLVCMQIWKHQMYFAAGGTLRSRKLSNDGCRSTLQCLRCVKDYHDGIPEMRRIGWCSQLRAATRKLFAGAFDNRMMRNGRMATLCRKYDPKCGSNTA